MFLNIYNLIVHITWFVSSFTMIKLYDMCFYINIIHG